VDFLPGLVAPRCKRVVLNWVNKLPVFFTFLHFIFLFYFCLSHDVGTLIGTSQTLKHLTEHIKTSALEFHFETSRGPILTNLIKKVAVYILKVDQLTEFSIIYLFVFVDLDRSLESTTTNAKYRKM
jgi:hypothetical protein